MTEIRRARPADARPIAQVHVAAWRSTYAGILPDHSLTGLSIPWHTARYDHDIRAGAGVFVALVSGQVVGFATAGSGRSTIAEGEVETLYVLDDYRDQGLGRRLLHAAAAYLAEQGCRSLFLWVLRDNPGRWFYERLGGRASVSSMTEVGGMPVPKVAYVWDPIGLLGV